MIKDEKNIVEIYIWNSSYDIKIAKMIFCCLGYSRVHLKKNRVLCGDFLLPGSN